MQADTHHTLAAIRKRTGRPIASTLRYLQKHGKLDERSLDWAKNLEILYLDDSAIVAGQKSLRRTRTKKSNYVAVSYTWNPTEDVPAASGSYLVQSRHRKTALIPSNVRDNVFDRVTAYVCYCRIRHFVRGFWIDQECIDQKNSAEKKVAVQSMEFVYSGSDFPVALLSRQVGSEENLKALVDLLEIPNFSKTGEPKFSGIFAVLEYLTSDSWWTRAWTFQEDYHSSTRMKLLISHSPDLEQLKRRFHKLFGRLEGEICIGSADFRTKATEFCMECQRRGKYQDQYRGILARAGKYKVQLEETDEDGEPTIRKSMSPVIFSNIGSRGIGVESDRLAVIANCCRYSVRLGTTKLENRGFSSSIAMLALFLLNGEILMNSTTNDGTAFRDSDIYEYVTRRSLSTFRPPYSVDTKLTFIKNCRLPNVRFSKIGIKTHGHLWKLRKVIQGPEATRRPPVRRDHEWNTLDDYERRRLRDLAISLRDKSYDKCYKTIASDIDNYLRQDKNSATVSFSRRYKNLMAREVVEAMDNGQLLRLGFIMPNNQNNRVSIPYRGIFVGDSSWEWTRKPTYVFTTMSPADKTKSSTDKHVSLEVGKPRFDRVPQLVVKRWVNGLVFFDETPRRDVLFPWPKSFLQ